MSPYSLGKLHNGFGHLILGIFGIVNMWLAIFADVGVMILAVLNAIRAMYVRNI